MEIDPCVPSACQNEALCVGESVSYTFTCYCRLGFTGQHCQINIDDCREHRCQHGRLVGGQEGGGGRTSVSAPKVGRRTRGGGDISVSTEGWSEDRRGGEHQCQHGRLVGGQEGEEHQCQHGRLVGGQEGGGYKTCWVRERVIEVGGGPRRGRERGV